MTDKIEGLRIFLVESEDEMISTHINNLRRHNEGMHSVVLIAQTLDEAQLYIPETLQNRSVNLVVISDLNGNEIEVTENIHSAEGLRGVAVMSLTNSYLQTPSWADIHVDMIEGPEVFFAAVDGYYNSIQEEKK